MSIATHRLHLNPVHPATPQTHGSQPCPYFPLCPFQHPLRKLLFLNPAIVLLRLKCNSMPAPRSFIVTVGTSALTNAGWRRGDPLPDVQAFWREASNREPSAEEATLKDLSLTDEDQFVFLTSNTAEGVFCGDYLTKRYSNAERRAVEDLDLKPSEDRSQRALRALANEIADWIRKARNAGLRPELVVTGGTKAQSAIASAIGLLLSAPCHSRMDREGPNFTLPRFPLKIDPQFFVETRTFWHMFEESERGFVDYATLQRGMQAFSEERREEIKAFVFEIENGVWGLSTFGDVLLATLQDQEQSESTGSTLRLSSRALEQWQNPPNARAAHAMRRLTQKIAILSSAGAFMPEAKKALSDLLFYPGGGKANAHVSLFLDENGQPNLCEFTFSHDDRDRMLAQQSAMRHRYEGFEPVKLN